MISYELAKQLKEAGFEQMTGDGHWEYNEQGSPELYYPALSELIEACGDGFYRLQKQGKKYLAYPTIEVIANETGWIEVSEQETPEIAVAKLWLAINRKD